MTHSSGVALSFSIASCSRNGGTPAHRAGTAATRTQAWTHALAAGRSALLAGELDTLAVTVDDDVPTALYTQAATSTAPSTPPRSPPPWSRSTRPSPPATSPTSSLPIPGRSSLFLPSLVGWLGVGDHGAAVAHGLWLAAGGVVVGLPFGL
jgi:hypothetical protein